MIVPVLLAGGSGTRLWPLSRKLYPKQFVPLHGDRTMFQQTAERVRGEVFSRPMVVCNEEHRFLVAEQLRIQGIEPETILLEPEGRNTAPAIALAALLAVGKGENPWLLVLPADHHIGQVDTFHAAIDFGRKVGGEKALITFGIEPTSAETGYGYVEQGEALAEEGALQAFRIRRFIEKPDQETAARFVQGGHHYWNSGMFLFRAGDYLDQMREQVPDMLDQVRPAFEKGSADGGFFRPHAELFAAIKGDSIDYAIMEHAREGVVIPLAVEWSDLGSWEALWKAGDKDGEGNVRHGDVRAIGCRGSYLHSTERLVAAVGVEDLVVVETADSVLIAPRKASQNVKHLVELLNADNRTEGVFHTRVYRPWGSYECISCSERFQVKRIVVKPGAVLSLQKHYHRAEHWVVVKGTALVTKGEDVVQLKEDESIYIPLGVLHRLENPGKIPLEIIEVQSGAYLGEDDIVRFDDAYGRTKSG